MDNSTKKRWRRKVLIIAVRGFQNVLIRYAATNINKLNTLDIQELYLAKEILEEEKEAEESMETHTTVMPYSYYTVRYSMPAYINLDHD